MPCVLANRMHTTNKEVTHLASAASLVGETGHVHAFEPSYSAARQLEKNVKLNEYSNITIHPKALTKERGLVHFYHRRHAAWGTLLDNVGFNPTQVYGVRLDDLISGTVDMIKIDVEGTEADVLAGATHTLMNKILMDLHPDLGVNSAPVMAALKGKYQLFDIRSGFIPIQSIPSGLVELLAVRS